MTHEAGTASASDHSLDPGATMYATVRPGEVTKRVLADDDIQGVCSIYPRWRRQHDLHRLAPGVGGGCGCTHAQTGPGAVLGALALLLQMSRRSRRKPQLAISRAARRPARACAAATSRPDSTSARWCRRARRRASPPATAVSRGRERAPTCFCCLSRVISGAGGNPYSGPLQHPQAIETVRSRVRVRCRGSARTCARIGSKLPSGFTSPYTGCSVSRARRCRTAGPRRERARA